ncbi:uncharacterized protein LTR77_008504 [Saxophila tyrrhenica]|uniref:Uncharacterized protein n=1 Tax=Saxophila tyrrhenica TaxID=1690608 RepID=A0AAV9P585_9PEZI|nr:hypothetical protein LTR77_008504 [Saxophila tyrrhenica]
MGSSHSKQHRTEIKSEPTRRRRAGDQRLQADAERLRRKGHEARSGNLYYSRRADNQLHPKPTNRDLFLGTASEQYNNSPKEAQRYRGWETTPYYFTIGAANAYDRAYKYQDSTSPKRYQYEGNEADHNQTSKSMDKKAYDQYYNQVSTSPKRYTYDDYDYNEVSKPTKGSYDTDDYKQTSKPPRRGYDLDDYN